ncbi:winged helix-turn-helix domain-containing protein [Dysgonomonas macrotermitis]|uniref:Winged helix-turn-helix domain n=1 Tax=Dysgonomonas macrotermitis TaxID=1346286 RepID=A0A1M4SQ20_9BACT|nr:winged helix-turn-helix domain-containing protein [Dysgonomonas macrotermitis]SHE34047.1 Winged helix-turn-helix domain [Dysgonomonas macrotermitis]
MIKEIVKKDAEAIYLLLTKRNTLTIGELREITEYQELYLSLVLGWLAKEGRVYLDIEDELSVAPVQKAV